MSKEDYFKIDPSLREKIDIEEVTVDGFDYSIDKTWVELKKESAKTYKKLKEREYIIRNKH